MQFMPLESIWLAIHPSAQIVFQNSVHTFNQTVFQNSVRTFTQTISQHYVRTLIQTVVQHSIRTQTEFLFISRIFSILFFQKQLVKVEVNFPAFHRVMQLVGIRIHLQQFIFSSILTHRLIISVLMMMKSIYIQHIIIQMRNSFSFIFCS